MENWITITCVALAVIVGMVLITWARRTRRILRLIQANPDEAYAFFQSHPENWALFSVSSSALQSDQLPVVVGAPQRKPLGPFEFHVTKLGGRTVSVFGKTRECLKDLEQFEFRMKVNKSGQPTSAGDVATRAVPEK